VAAVAVAVEVEVEVEVEAGTMEQKRDRAPERCQHQATADQPFPVLSFYAMVSSISP
jgi:hypothetical protein